MGAAHIIKKGIIALAALALLSLAAIGGCRPAVTKPRGGPARDAPAKSAAPVTMCVVTGRDGMTRQVDFQQVDNGTVSFAVYGDSREGPAVFRRLLDQVNASHPLFAIDNGDLVSNGTAAAYQEFAALIKAARQPLFTTAGNHDVEGSGAALYRSYFGTSDYWFDWASVRFVFLDSSAGILGADRLQWCDSVLAGRGDSAAVVITHVPPFDPRPGQSHALADINDAAAFMDLMTRRHVLRVYAAHIHGYYTADRGGVAYVITGGAGAPLVDTGAFYHFVLVTIDNGQIKETVVPLVLD